MDDVVVPPLKTIQGLFAVTQEMAEGAGRGGTERALGVHYLLPFGQVIGACQAVSGGSGRPGHDPLGDGKDEALTYDPKNKDYEYPHYWLKTLQLLKLSNLSLIWFIFVLKGAIVKDLPFGKSV